MKKAVDIESQNPSELFELSHLCVRPEGAILIDDIKNIYRILAHQHKFNSINDAISALLQYGCSCFRMERAFVLQRISDQVFDVKALYEPEKLHFIAQHIPASTLKILELHSKERVVVDFDIINSTINTSQLAYNLQEARAYIGISTLISGAESGVVCFVSNISQKELFDPEDILLLELLAEGIACMTELQSARTQRKTEDLAIFASGSIQSLEEYQASAELPEGLGISGKVVDVLKRRIGQSSLNIDNIAEELNLSKRTLQRRLQQQGISFAELRDKVRFHYSIDFLVKQQISIDRISSTLDFSDRTSFTNAFKRWTGLSPSTFRKVFRDYV